MPGVVDLGHDYFGVEGKGLSCLEGRLGKVRMSECL